MYNVSIWDANRSIDQSINMAGYPVFVGSWMSITHAAYLSRDRYDMDGYQFPIHA